MNSVKKRRRAVVDPSACVACGCCVKVCPLQAIEIVRGVMAQAVSYTHLTLPTT